MEEGKRKWTFARCTVCKQIHQFILDQDDSIGDFFCGEPIAWGKSPARYNNGFNPDRKANTCNGNGRCKGELVKVHRNSIPVNELIHLNCEEKEAYYRIEKPILVQKGESR